MEYFIAQAKIILPVLGVNILRSTAAAVHHAADTEPASAGVSSPVFELHVKRDGISATAREVHGEFTVLEGSGTRAAWTVEHAYKVLREKLVREGAIVPGHDGRAMRFARDQVFASPSAAAAVVVGRPANGRSDWKIQGSGVSFGDWQAQGIEQAAREGSP